MKVTSYMFKKNITFLFCTLLLATVLLSYYWRYFQETSELYYYFFLFNLHYWHLSPLKYPLPLFTHFFQRCFHFTKQPWKISFEMSCNAIGEFVLMLSLISKLCPPRTNFNFGNENKFQCFISGE